ncbi:non-ribosomal peptide synthetase [Nocardia albiluteola]
MAGESGQRQRRGAAGRPVRRRGRSAPTLAQLVAAAVELNPLGIAVDDGDLSMTYAELDRWSSRAARALIARGIGPEDAVAVGIPRSVWSVAAVWAVVKTGAAFVPIDPGYPASRVERMVVDSGAVLGLTVEATAGELPGGLEWLAVDSPEFGRDIEDRSDELVLNEDRVRQLRITHPAYVIYTSGSTGVPKGVTVTHAGLANFSAEQRERYGVTSASRTLHFASPSFDASVLELLLALGAGATMVVAPVDVYGGADLAQLLRTQRVTHAFITPAALASVDPAGLDDLEVLVAGGEACPPELVNRWAGGSRRFHNGYGPTETTIMTNISDPLVPGEPATIGTAIRGMASRILTDRLEVEPVGGTGELYLAGPGVARGYHARPGLTAARFVADPFGEPGSRMYRTGDLGRVDIADGPVLHMGRNDFQVKIRGFRIELGEIDSVLSAHEAVDFAVTVGHTTSRDNTVGGNTALVSYVIPVAGASIDTAELLAFAGRQLPGYMVPAALTVLDKLPLTPVGKLDRAALPEPVFAAAQYREPTGPVERVVAEVFADLLGAERVGLDDDFFALGGNSLLATQAVARIRAATGTQFPARVLFEASTVQALAQWVSGLESTNRPVLAARERPEAIPLAPAQQRMWLLNQFDTASPMYNVPVAIRLTGPLDIAALGAAVGDVIDRHEILRTVYPEVNGTVAQRILDPELPDLTPVDAPGPDELRTGIEQVALSGFDVSEQVPFRMALFALGAPGETADHALVFAAHHIAVDGWSLGPLTRDLMYAYAARSGGVAPAWTPLPLQYADYSVWHRELLGEDTDPESLAAAHVEFWRNELAGIPELMGLPADFPRPPAPSGAGKSFSFEIPAAVHAKLGEVAAAANATPFMVVHAAFAALLARITGSDDIVIGTPVAGRGEPELADLIGMFVNTVTLRTRIDPARTFADLVAHTRERDLVAFDHAELPFERLVEVLAPGRTAAYNPLFQVALFFQNMAAPTLELDELTVSQLELDTEAAKFDLQLTISPGADDNPWGAQFSYATDLFAAETIAGFAERFVRLLEAVAHDPGVVVGDIDVLAPQERGDLLRELEDTAHTVPGTLLLEGYRRAVAAAPEAVALVFDDDIAWTYREFDAWVNRLAHYLIEQGIGPESVVALAMPRSPELVVAMYAVISAGGAYLPLDLEHPAGRIAYVLETAQPVCVLSKSGHRPPDTDLPVINIDTLDLSHLPIEPVNVPLSQDHPAYVLFTSGSTGRPKGVMVSHAAIRNQIEWMAAQYEVDSGDVYLQKTATTFDVSLWGYFLPLSVGAQLVLAAPDGQRDPEYIASLIALHEVTLTDFVPSVLQVFLAAARAEQLTWLREVFVIGEALPPSTVAAFAALSSAGLHNLYGPTEAAVSVTYWPATPADRTTVPIGLPQWNTRTYVLDSRLHLTPFGAAGELYLAGDQLARGYLRRPDLSADRFVADPYGPPGARMYRTGDLVRRRADGVLEYLGRIDFQAKIRGHRIELGEVEAALLADPAIAQAVALVAPSPAGDQLAAYVVAADGDIDTDAVRRELSQVLPSYMLPAALVVLDAFPMNSSGKLDRAALPAPVFEAREYLAPATATERAVAEVFGEVLGIDRVGAADGFFELGGTSLLAFTLQRALNARLGIDLPMATLFTAPTVRALAARVDGTDSAPVTADESDLIAADAVLEPEIGADDSAPPYDSVLDVLLTGATGFLGVHLLRELLVRTESRVWCLVRADSAELAHARIRESLRQYRIWEEGFRDRIVAVPGDLAAPEFGLTPADYRRLTERIDVIYHNGARVNHIEPYSRLRAANVEGTRQVLRLATTTRIKPVHFVSTANAVIPATLGPDFRGAEDDRLSVDQLSANGYVASKWVAEQLVTQAAERGVPVRIYRPATISGDPHTGVNSADDSFWNMIRAVAVLGLAPDVGDAEMALVPVNYVVRAIVSLATEPADGAAYHLVNTNPVAITDIFEGLRRHGIPVAPASLEEIGTRLAAEAAARDAAGDHSLVRAALLSGNYGAAAIAIDDTATRAVLADRGIECPRIDAETLDAYIESFLETGFFPAPGEAQSGELLRIQ